MGTTARDGFYRRGRVWWLRTDPVTGRPVSTRSRTLDGAREFREQRMRVAAEPGYATAAERARRETLVEWSGRLIALKRRQGKRADFHLQKAAHWPRLLSGAGALPEERRAEAVRSVTLADVTPESVDRAIAERRAEGVSDHTITKELGVLLQVMRLAWRAGAYPTDPAILRPPDLSTDYQPRERALPLEEVRALMPHLSSVLAVVVARCVAFGARLSEALELDESSFDWERGVVRIRGTKTARSDRVVPMLSVFSELIAVAASAPALAKPNNLYRDLRVACKRAGIDACSPNDLRRSHATILREAGVSERDTADLLGHTSVEMVRRVYARPRATAIGQRIERQLAAAGLACNETVASPGAPQRRPVSPSALQQPKMAGLRGIRVFARNTNRLPKPKVARSNRAGSAASTWPAPRSCNKIVASGLPRLALAYAAHAMGVLP